VGLDLTQLCWCVRTASAAIVSKPQSDWCVFVSLTGLDWTRLDSVGVYTPLAVYCEQGMDLRFPKKGSNFFLLAEAQVTS